MGLETAALISLAGLALGAAGTGAQVYSSAQEGHAANRAAEEELRRQGGYQKKATQEFQKSLAQSTPAVRKQQQAEGTQRILDTIRTVGGAPVTTPSSVADVTPSSIVGKEAGAVNTMANQATAQYGGMNEWQLRQWIKDLRAQQQLGIISDMARGSASTLPFIMNQAGQSAEEARLVGQGLSGLGSAVGAYGATRGMPRTQNLSWLYNLPTG